MAQMRLGVATSIPWWPGYTQEECYRYGMRLAEMTEELGFDAFWVTEHHFAVHGLASGITAILATVAAKTERIRIGPAVFVLPYWNPVRLAEDVATLDLLSGGRIEFAVGSGYRVEEFRGFNVPPGESREMAQEALRLVLELWKGEPVTFQGKYYHVEELVITPLPKQKPHPPVWYGANSLETIDYAARHGYNWMTASTLLDVNAIAERRRYYEEALRRYGRDPSQARVYAHVPTYVHPAGYEKVREDAYDGVQYFHRAARGAGTIYDQQAASQGGIARSEVDFDLYYQNNFFGTPNECYEKIVRFCELVRPTDLNFLFTHGPAPENALRSVELFAKEVLPAIRQLSFS